ncbi:ubiquitin-conjugating enzyme E2 U isoform 1-T2 [Mantella aurantiaca]
MHSRAYLLLERDYEDLQEAPLYGISVRPATDSFLTWIAKIGGLKDSLWEGAALQVSLSFTEEFNDVSPTVTFNTIPFHPNVDPKTGKPCVDFLDEPSDWNPRYTMTFILLAIQTLLSNPVMEDVVNLEAADVLFNRPEVYRDMVLNCVKISRQIDAGSVQDWSPVREISTMETTPAPRKIKNISFEDYHKNWSEIATSTDGRKGRESGNQYKQTNETHITNKRYDIMIREVIDKRTEMIPSSQPGREEGSHNCVFCRLSENCGIEFLGHAEPHTSRRLDFNGDSARRFRDGEPQEEEVDQLVAWTNTLSSELLED